MTFQHSPPGRLGPVFADAERAAAARLAKVRLASLVAALRTPRRA